MDVNFRPLEGTNTAFCRDRLGVFRLQVVRVLQHASSAALSTIVCILIIIIVTFLETCWEPPEAHWSQTVQNHVINF